MGLLAPMFGGPRRFHPVYLPDHPISSRYTCKESNVKPTRRGGYAPSRERPPRRAARTTTRSLRLSPGREYFFRVVEQLKIHLPLSRPVVVQVGRQLSGADGDCCVLRRKFQIRVSRELNESEAVDCLLHEWAHALSWDACVGKVAHSRSTPQYEFDLLSHGPKWGLAYSRVYRCFTSEIVLRLAAEDLNPPVARRRRVHR